MTNAMEPLLYFGCNTKHSKTTASLGLLCQTQKKQCRIDVFWWFAVIFYNNHIWPLKDSQVSYYECDFSLFMQPGGIVVSAQVCADMKPLSRCELCRVLCQRQAQRAQHSTDPFGGLLSPRGNELFRVCPHIWFPSRRGVFRYWLLLPFKYT